jgi:hypothetical protein
VVLLASQLISTDDGTGHAFLQSCRRHVADDGCVIIQQFRPGWFAAVSDGETTRDGMLSRLRDVSRPAPDLISATIEYVADDRRWMQTFTAVRLDEASSAPR